MVTLAIIPVVLYYTDTSWKKKGDIFKNYGIKTVLKRTGFS